MKLNILVLYDPAIMLLDISLNELKTYIHTKLCIWIVYRSFIIIAQTWKQPIPSVGEGINKLWYTQTMEYYSVLKVNKK